MLTDTNIKKCFYLIKHKNKYIAVLAVLLITVLSCSTQENGQPKGKEKRTILKAYPVPDEYADYQFLDDLKSDSVFDIVKIEGVYNYNHFPNPDGLSENGDMLFMYYPKNNNIVNYKRAVYCVLNKSGDVIENFTEPEGVHFICGDYILGPNGYCNWLIDGDTAVHPFPHISTESKETLKDYHNKSDVAIRFYRENSFFMLIDNRWHKFLVEEEINEKDNLYTKCSPSNLSTNIKSFSGISVYYIGREQPKENPERLYNQRLVKIKRAGQYYSEKGKINVYDYEGVGYFNLRIEDKELKYKYPTSETEFGDDLKPYINKSLKVYITDEYTMVIDANIKKCFYVIKHKEQIQKQ